MDNFEQILMNWWEVSSVPALQILLVDDDADIRDTLGDALRARGYDVATARHGEDALAKLASGLRPSVIILDLMMPTMDGWRFRSELLKDPDLAKIPIIVTSVTGEYWGLPENVSGRLVKPFRLDDLGREIDRVTGLAVEPPESPVNVEPRPSPKGEVLIDRDSGFTPASMDLRSPAPDESGVAASSTVAGATLVIVDSSVENLEGRSICDELAVPVPSKTE